MRRDQSHQRGALDGEFSQAFRLKGARCLLIRILRTVYVAERRLLIGLLAIVRPTERERQL